MKEGRRELINKKYKDAKTLTQNKVQQVVMLYDGILKYCQLAREAIERGDIQERYNNIEKCGNIITGLQGALDFTLGGAIASILNNYYNNLYMKLMNIHESNSSEKISEIIEEIKQMRSAWEEVHDIEENSQAEIASSNQNSTEISC